MKRHPPYQKGDTTKDFDFKKEIGFVSEIYTKNDLKEKTEGVYYVDKGFQYKNGDYVAIMVKGKIKFRKIVHIKRMMVYDRFADKMKECTCFKVNVLDLVKYFEDFSCHESDGYFEVYSDNVKNLSESKGSRRTKRISKYMISVLQMIALTLNYVTFISLTKEMTTSY